MNKVEELSVLIDKLRPHVIGAVETWLDGSHCNDDIAMEGYETIMKNRCSKPNRGGLCIYVRKEIPINSNASKCYYVYTFRNINIY